MPPPSAPPSDGAALSLLPCFSCPAPPSPLCSLPSLARPVATSPPSSSPSSSSSCSFSDLFLLLLLLLLDLVLIDFLLDPKRNWKDQTPVVGRALFHTFGGMKRPCSSCCQRILRGQPGRGWEGGGRAEQGRRKEATVSIHELLTTFERKG